MKKLEHLDKYVMAPNVGFYGGFRYEGEDMDLCDDREASEGYEFAVKQQIVAGVLITDLTRSHSMRNGKTVSEQSHMEVELEKGQLIVYVQGMGFTLPSSKMCLLREAIEQFEILENPVPPEQK